MKNVSEDGLAIKLVDPVRLEGVVIVEFELPSVEPQTFSCKSGSSLENRSNCRGLK
jgi:hypothetical protein